MFRIKRRFDEQKEEFFYFPSLNYEENVAEEFYGTGGIAQYLQNSQVN